MLFKLTLFDTAIPSDVAGVRFQSDAAKEALYTGKPARGVASIEGVPVGTWEVQEAN